MAEMMNRITRGAQQVRDRGEELVSGSIQSQLIKLPSDAFLWLAVGSIAGSLTLQMLGKKEESLFVGQWAPTFVLLGLFDKLIKIAGTSEG